LENAKRRLRVAFEFFKKLGVEYWTFHDRDIAPVGSNFAETNKIWMKSLLLQKNYKLILV